MDAYTTYLFAALAVLGGVIAWLGDVIGARLGKQRRTLFGLRPRQSARLIAVVVGALLPLTGLLVATVGSEYARKAVFEMDSLLRDLDQLRAQVAQYREQAAQYRDQAEQARQAADQARQDAQRSAAELSKAEEQVEALIDRQHSLTHQVSSLAGQVAQRERAVAAARGDLQRAQQQLGRATQEVAAAEAELRRVREQSRLTGVELKRAQERLANARNAEAEARAEVEAKLARLTNLQNDLAEVQRQLDVLKERDRLIAMREPLFETGDELTARFLIDADETQDQMESTLFELLHLASLVAERAGVPVGPNGRAVVVVAPTPRELPPGATVPEAVIVRHVASELRSQGTGQWVVVVRVFRRYFAGDEGQLEVRFWAKPNLKVFAAGEVLAELVVPAGKSEAEIRALIYQTIASREKSPVRAMAIARGMLPNRDTGTYGAADLNEIIETAAAVARRPEPSVVRFLAKQDTYTIGPLLIGLQVTAASATP